MDIIDTRGNPGGSYSLSGDVFLPAIPDYTYVDPDDPEDFYSGALGGASMLPNGNILVCEGGSGHIFELDSSQQIVWDYVNPVVIGGPVSQGNSASTNGVFRVQRFTADYPALVGKDLSPGAPIELNPIVLAGDSCAFVVSSPEVGYSDLQVYPNPSQGLLQINPGSAMLQRAELFDLQGRMRWSTAINLMQVIQVDLSSKLEPGMYQLVLFLEDGTREAHCFILE